MSTNLRRFYAFVIFITEDTIEFKLLFILFFNRLRLKKSCFLFILRGEFIFLFYFIQSQTKENAC